MKRKYQGLMGGSLLRAIKQMITFKGQGEDGPPS